MSRDALVVGINTYRSLNPLNAPAVDAEAIAQRLQQEGEFRVWRSPEIMQNNQSQVGKNTPLSLPELERALVDLFKPGGRQIPDTALFYFSGHGLRKDVGISEGYLATSDVNPAQSIFGLSLQWLRRLLEESPVRQQIIWLDCCHSGALLNVDEANPGERGQGRDRCFIAASRDYQVAYEEFGGAHSVLTQALLNGLD
ncbi:MAG: caspase family protein, partial [Cyanobacteria bacterium CAN_BIN43]|nr:caspase family protein [Cyanobacteria bacterium CAN_BIN43]